MKTFRKRNFSRKTFRKTTRFGKRKRFARKGFKKSNSTYTKIAGSTIGKNALVKLTYRKDWDSVIGSADVWNDSGKQTYGLTYPVSNQPSSMCFLGSHCCTPLGTPNGITSDPDIAESYPLALQNYQQFYNKAICYGSSIKINVMPVATDISLRWVLLPIATASPSEMYRPNEGTSVVKADLDLRDFPSLCAYPGAQWGFVKPGNNGPTWIKAFRKTKSMLGLKDIKDNQDALEMDLPSAAAPNAGFNSRNTDAQGWLWYLRFFNSTSGVSGLSQFMVQIKYYLQLVDRQPMSQVSSTVA